MSATQLRSFLARARPYRRQPGFDSHEIEPKIRIGGEFHLVREAYRHRSKDAFVKLEGAFHAQKLVDWRHYDPLLRAWGNRRNRARAALTDLWDGSGDVLRRFARFSSALDGLGLQQPGAQLSIGSVLLMAVSPFEYPHVLTDDFNAAFALAGYPRFSSNWAATERYRHALDFFDLLISHGPSSRVAIQNRLEARALAWSVGRGVDLDEYAERLWTEIAADVPEHEALRLVTARARRRLTRTEKQTIMLARLGQGQFRIDLLQMWGMCSVTGCRHESMIRASHIKPWKDSTNTERLDKYNGLLLTPALDASFDRGLITFSDRGAIRISSTIKTRDSECLGIHRTMKLARVDRQHIKYLRYHRDQRFLG